MQPELGARVAQGIEPIAVVHHLRAEDEMDFVRTISIVACTQGGWVGDGMWWVWRGVVWRVVVWRGEVWRDVAWRGVA